MAIRSRAQGDGKPRPGTVVIGGKNRTGTEGTLYIEWRSWQATPAAGRLSPREALDQLAHEVFELGGEAPEPDSILRPAVVPLANVAPSQPPAPTSPTIAEAMSVFLKEVKATKSRGTLEAYTGDTRWFEKAVQTKLGIQNVHEVTQTHIIELLGEGRDQGLSQPSINRRVMIGLCALRS